MDKHTDDRKVIAIVSYITFVGLIVAFILNQEKKDQLISFHVRQSLMIHLTGIVMGIVLTFNFIRFLDTILWFLLTILWLMGLIYAIQGEMKEVPVLGPYAQQWFRGM
ncbi:hypothetical protein COV20_05565 [Candidatus Woesearchaeota archaeon CG10_big_fil_rev_8_21_14_0_10_45_16]|nr:MAG: hypothetical protein COV20_05565 [Candidatus Woesearchaeota archaeon CG10_big_fil_rev_8_21_14_0_10_45_16]